MEDNMNTEIGFQCLTRDEKKRLLFDEQKKTLDLFMERGAISKNQHDKSLHDLIEKMGMSSFCPGGYRYYYVEQKKLVGRTQEDNCFNSEVYQPGSGWVYDVDHEISDCIMGYEPGEEPGWGIGNTDIMGEIRSITRDEAVQLILRL